MADEDPEVIEKPVVVADAGTPPPTAVEPAPPTPRKPAPTMEQLFGIPTEVTAGLGKIKQQEIDEKTRIMRESEGLVAQDRALAKKHFDAMGVEAEKMQPWNANEEYKKVATAPLEAFGSFASVFAIVASAFTHAPLEHALNGSAAALNAIKKGDDEAYERGYNSWKTNMDLFQKRFNMQNTMYKDAMDLMSRDQQAGQIKMQNAAIRFGDQKALFLLNNGFDKELIDLQTSRIRQFQAITEAGDKMDQSAFRRQAFDALMNDFQTKNKREPDALETVQMWNYSHGIKEDWKQQLMNQFLMKNQGDPDIEKKAAAYAQSLNAMGRGGGSRVNQYMTKWKTDFIAEHGAEPTAEQERIAEQEYHAAMRKEDQKAKAIKELQEQYTAKGEPISLTEATRRYNLQTKVANFTPQEQRRLTAVPTLMKHLEVLDWYANQTGPIKFIPAHIAAVYGGLNDPQQIYETALKGAKNAVLDYGAGGTTLKKALETRLDRMPGNFQDPRFNKRLTQELMRDVAGEAKNMISLLEGSGKNLPPDVLQEYTKWGIYPQSVSKQDPINYLRTDPQVLSNEQLLEMTRRAPIMAPDDQKRLRAEIMRRKQAEQPKAAPAPVVVPQRSDTNELGM